MRVHVAMAGLATSHPYSDARYLRRLVDAEFTVWEPDADRLDRFLDEHEAHAVDSLDGLLAANPDGAVVTVQPHRTAAVLQPLLAAGIPVFANKPAAVTLDQLAELDRIVTPHQQRFMTCSVLRFAPAFEAFRWQIQRTDVLAARVVVRHDVGRWTRETAAWQDDPHAGGGLVSTMGVHGVELLVALFGIEIAEVRARRSVRHYPTLRSEDVAYIDLSWADGLLATVEILGVATEESYTVTVHHAASDRTVELRDDGSTESPFGYAEAAVAFTEMIYTGQAPIEWSVSRGVLRALALARAASLPTHI